MKGLLLLSLAAAFLVSCSSNTPAKRIEKNPAVFQALSAEHQNLVRQGRIEEGMPTTAVFLAWGNPESKSEGEKEGKRFERWNYIGLTPVYRHSFYGGVGYGYGRYGRYRRPYYGGGTGVDYIPYRAAYVDFHNNHVESWQRGR